MGLFYYISLLIIFSTIKVSAQNKETEYYRSAIEYLNDYVYSKKVDNSIFEKNCLARTKGLTKLDVPSGIQIAERFIRNDHAFPLEAMVNVKYNISKDCLRDLRMRIYNCPVNLQIKDSLNHFWSDYRPKSFHEMKSTLSSLVNFGESGYVVFFSDLHKNGLAAELMSFCTSYKSNTTWQGASTIFYFVFDDQGNVEEVYSGKGVSYN